MPRNPFRLNRTIGRSFSVSRDDVLKVKTALDGLGFYDVPDFGLTPFPDEVLFTGIEKFQSANGLKKDGIMKPDGPTVSALWRRVSQEVDRSRSDARRRTSEVTKECPQGYYPTLRRICIPGTDICWDRWECAPMPSGDGPRG